MNRKIFNQVKARLTEIKNIERQIEDIQKQINEKNEEISRYLWGEYEKPVTINGHSFVLSNGLEGIYNEQINELKAKRKTLEESLDKSRKTLEAIIKDLDDVAHLLNEYFGYPIYEVIYRDPNANPWD